MTHSVKPVKFLKQFNHNAVANAMFAVGIGFINLRRRPRNIEVMLRGLSSKDLQSICKQLID